MSSEVRQEWWSRPLGHVLWLFITLVCATLRKTVRGDTHALGSEQTIVALWHNRIFIPCYFYRYIIRGTVCMSMLTSASKDGTMLSTIANNYGMRTVRGSAHRRGAAGFIDMMRELREGMSMCITPDGPKGPRYRCHPGVIKLASMSGLPITPLKIRFGACVRMRSWDRFYIPLPFARVDMEVCPPIMVPQNLSDDELKQYCRRLEDAMGGDLDFSSV